MKFNPERLVLARKLRGLSQRDLASKLELTSRHLNSIEKGTHAPKLETVEEISNELKFNEEFFFKEEKWKLDSEGASFRAYSNLTAKDRNVALALGSLAAMVVDEIEKQYILPETMVPDLRGYDPEEAAQIVRHEWNLGEKPIPNMLALLESKGVRIFSLTKIAYEVDAFCFWKDTNPLVLVNTTKSSERVRFDLAHELGHLVLHRHGENKGRVCEQQADEFASAFLMPKASLYKHSTKFGNLASIKSIKKIWGVSLAALVFRAHKISLLTDWHYKKFCIDIAKSGYRKKEPNPMKKESSVLLKKIDENYRKDGAALIKISDTLGMSRDDFKSLLSGLTILSVANTNKSLKSSNNNSKPILKLV